MYEPSTSLPEPSTSLPEPSTSLPEPSTSLPEHSKTMSDYLEVLNENHTVRIPLGNDDVFKFYVTEDDFKLLSNKQQTSDGLRITLNDLTANKTINDLKSDTNSVVIYPLFTSAAYKQNAFYYYYAGVCDESCLTDISFENPEFIYTSSGISAQILYALGYDFLTDVQVDRNPELLKNYDNVILLHNEYVTKKMFDAISTHPHLIFLHPNALYAEVEVNYDQNTITLIRGHNYPEQEIYNGFDYAIEEKFHKYEYDADCLEWEFIEIPNGHHLNCYPERLVISDLGFLIKMNSLLK
uniref:Uncharacterized protein n=1 Tax=uncultured marine thaumarchaeote KM3_84_A09 TaxID=1456310 RepID=A0A075HVW7_9ARCH|nr:hypothetical protein [uncultured marine thaumarchaeote KM3_84_A09]